MIFLRKKTSDSGFSGLKAGEKVKIIKRAVEVSNREQLEVIKKYGNSQGSNRLCDCK
jgi:hypothetical protein